MDLDQLNNMKYADLQKLAKEKLNITKRVSKAKLIQSLMELNWLSDDGTDKSADEAPEPEEEIKPRRGRKRGKNSSNEIKEEEESPPKNLPAKKKSKIHEPEITLNSTFNVDKEDFLSSDNQSENELPIAPTKSESKPKARGRVRKAVRKSNQKLQESSSSEFEAADKTQEIVDKTQDSLVSSVPKVPEPSEAPATMENDKITSTTVQPEKTRRLSNRTVQIEKTSDTQLKTPGQPINGVKRRSIIKATEVGKPAAVTPMSTKKGIQLPSGTSTSKLKPRAAPNFAEIHQRQFEKMQSVDEYVEKKRQRTEIIATSSAVKTIPRKRSITKTPNENAKNRTISSPNPAVPSPNPAPAAKTKLNFNFVSGIQKPVFTAQGLVATEKKRLMATLKENHLGQGNTAVKTMKKSSLAGTTKVDLSSSIVANGNRNKQVSTEGKQQVLKGVRVNRRFQLQMQHRNLKN